MKKLFILITALIIAFAIGGVKLYNDAMEQQRQKILSSGTAALEAANRWREACDKVREAEALQNNQKNIDALNAIRSQPLDEKELEDLGGTIADLKEKLRIELSEAEPGSAAASILEAQILELSAHEIFYRTLFKSD